MHEDFNFRIEKKDGILEIISNNGGNSCNRSLYLSYENALWLINKLRPMTFEELTNNLKFDTKKEIVDFKYNVLFFDRCFVDRGNCWFDISLVWNNDDSKYGSMTLPFSIIEQFEDKFYFREFVYPFLDELEKYLPKELNISYDKDSIIIWLNGLENDEYAFCWGLDFLKSQNSFKLDKSQGNGLGLGCGVQNFSFDGIHCEFEYDEMVGLWIETKDANEGSPEEIKQKIISFGQRIFDELIRKENEQKLRGF